MGYEILERNLLVLPSDIIDGIFKVGVVVVMTDSLYVQT